LLNVNYLNGIAHFMENSPYTVIGSNPTHGRDNLTFLNNLKRQLENKAGASTNVESGLCG